MSALPVVTIIQVCNEDKRRVLSSEHAPYFQYVSLGIAYESLGQFNLMHSLAATPARYVEAAVHRFLSWNEPTDLLVLNPWVRFDDVLYSKVFDLTRKAMGKTADLSAVITDVQDRPVAFLFSRSLLKSLDPRRIEKLRFMSCVSSSLDANYLSTALGTRFSLSMIADTAELDESAGFLIKDCYPLIYSLITHHALRAPAKTVAVMPYHAGDVLFFLKALEGVSHPFNCLLIHREYADIARAVAPNLELILVEESPLLRGDNTDPDLSDHANSESRFFMNVLYPYIPQDAAFYYFRVCRDHHLAKFHFTDQWKFALSNDSHPLVAEREQTLSGTPSLPANSKSVLLHFDGGWSLKVYPYEKQLQLISLLKKSGYEVSVLTDRPYSYDCPTYAFEGLEQLTEKIRGHSIFVGMDSFPVHYSTHVLNHPTLCLFSSTLPVHANARMTERYEFLNRGLGCSPCHQKDHCAKYTLDYCENFSTPQAVHSSVESIYRNCYEASL